MDVSKLAQLPGQFASFPPAAKEFAIALAAIPNDKEYADQCTEVLTQVGKKWHFEKKQEFEGKLFILNCQRKKIEIWK